MTAVTKYLLEESQMPKSWYNIQADLPKALPPVLHPGTLEPIGPADLAPLFPMELILQEVSTEREIEIPEPVRENYRLWRPAPQDRAHRLDTALGTPATLAPSAVAVAPSSRSSPTAPSESPPLRLCFFEAFFPVVPLPAPATAAVVAVAAEVVVVVAAVLAAAEALPAPRAASTAAGVEGGTAALPPPLSRNCCSASLMTLPLAATSVSLPPDGAAMTMRARV